MGLLKSAITARRFRIEGELTEGFRDAYMGQILEHAFREPMSVTGERVEGWTVIDDLMGTDFEDINRWFVQNWILLGYRVDQRKLPSNKVNAELKKRCNAWASERGVERCPSSVRSEIKDELQQEWLARVMPTTKHYEIAWNLDTNIAYVSTQSDNTCDYIRKTFYRTFGRAMHMMGPLDWVGDEAIADELIRLPPTKFT
jgi:DNA recombination-dependent growth factor C